MSDTFHLLTDADRDALVEALRFDRCEYGCAITYTQESVKYDLAPAVERIVAGHVAAERERIAQAIEAHAPAAPPLLKTEYQRVRQAQRAALWGAARIARGGE